MKEMDEDRRPWFMEENVDDLLMKVVSAGRRKN